MYLLNLQNCPDFFFSFFCFPLEINGIESLADCRSSEVLPSLLLNLRNGLGVPDRVNKHWSSKEVAENWKQSNSWRNDLCLGANRRPLHVSVDTGSNPRPDQRRHMVPTNWVLLRPSLFSLFCFFYPQIFSCAFTSLCLFPTIIAPSTFSYPRFSSCLTWIAPSLPDGSIAIPLS